MARARSVVSRLTLTRDLTRDLGRTRPRLTSAGPAAAYIARLAATATFAYLLALQVPAGTSRPVLAPLTALLVLQASLYQTIRSGIRKVVAVTAGVLVAVAVSAFVAFSWWQLGLLIGGALLLGRVLRLGDDLLEVPISAMLIFSSSGHNAAAAGRIVDTLVGTLAGLAGGLVFAPPRVQPAREAVGDLACQLAGLLHGMAGDLAGDLAKTGADWTTADRANCAPEPARVADWLTRSRSLRDQIEQVDDTLRAAADSVRLNPRSRFRRGPGDVIASGVALRAGLESLEHAALTIRGLARSVLDSSGIDSPASPVRDARTRAQLASLLIKLGEAIETYGRLVQTMPAGSDALESALAEQLAQARRLQDELADILRPRAADPASSEWPLRGEILAHVDRLRTGLRVEDIRRQRRSIRRGERRPRPAHRRPVSQQAFRPRIPA